MNIIQKQTEYKICESLVLTTVIVVLFIMAIFIKFTISFYFI